MKKKDFLIKVTIVDLMVVSIMFLAGVTVPVFRNLILSTGMYNVFIYGVMCINIVADLLLLVLNKFKKAGYTIRNMATYFLIFKLFVLFLASLLLIVFALAG